jgi:hypothetical protein
MRFTKALRHYINNKASNTHPHPTTFFSALGPGTEHWPRVPQTLNPSCLWRQSRPWCLSKHHAIRTYGECGGVAPRVLDFGTGWMLVVSFAPRPLYPRGKSPGTHWIRRWVDPRPGLDVAAKRRILPLYWLRHPGSCDLLIQLNCLFNMRSLWKYHMPIPDDQKLNKRYNKRERIWQEEKNPLGITRRRWEDNIKMDLREILFGGMNWIIWLRIGTGGGLSWTR